MLYFLNFNKSDLVAITCELEVANYEKDEQWSTYWSLVVWNIKKLTKSKIETIGTISNMKYSKNFEDTVTDFMSKVMDFIKEQKEFNNKIMSLPTIKKELSELPKK